MLQYLKEFHGDDITNLLNDSNDSLHVSLNVNLTHLQRLRPHLFAEILQDVWTTTPKWDRALLEAQKELIEGNCFLEDGYQVKENCHVRFVNLPQFEGPLKGLFPGNDQVGQFVQVKGNVVRMTQGRLLEFKREYQCTRCKETYTLEAQYKKMYVFETPKRCPEPSGLCKGTLQPKHAHPKPEYCKDYQEIRLQELFSDKYIPASLQVTLEDDLVDYCQPGDCATICGTVEIRWPQMTKGKRFEVLIVLRAVSVFKDEEKINFGKDLSEQLVWVRAQWQDTVDTVGYLNARDMIVRSICPEIHGMYLVKLAIALALCSGVQCVLSAGTNKRGSSHLLLVGDPGLAKSKLLKAASKIAVRSVHTTGMGCSAAGLTAAAIKEEGEWQLEAGALVLADGGVCCIDEFNLMSEHDKASIHEAMEQQTISMAKAGLVCKLSTRCVVIAATNPKNLYSMSESEGTSFINIGIGSPLLSRFDVVLILRDERDPEWDNRISDHILQNTNKNIFSDDIWELERLQSHFLAVQEINPQLSDEANIILGSYYKHCRSDEMRDSSRTTARLLDSLNRLAQGHARLMFREKVEAVDAIAIIRLMESSWGFGRLLNSIDILREDLPLGPDENQVVELMGLLGLETLNQSVLENLSALAFSKRKSDENKSKSKVTSPTNPIIGNLQNLFGFNKENIKKLQLDDAVAKQKEQRHEPNLTKPLTPKNKNKTNKTTPKSTKRTEKSSPVNKPKTPKHTLDLIANFTPVAANKSDDKCLELPNEEKLSSKELSQNSSSFDAFLLEDSSDMDLFKTLESVEPENKNDELKSSVLANSASSSDVAKKTNKDNGKVTKGATVEISDRKSKVTNASTSNKKSISLPSYIIEPIAGPSRHEQPIAGPSTLSKPETSTSDARQSWGSTLKKRLFETVESSEYFDQNDSDLDMSQSRLNTSSNDILKNITEKPSTLSHLQEHNESRNISPPTTQNNKKARLSFGTLSKLNSFVNPKYVEVVKSPPKESPNLNKNARINTEDSAYNSMSASSLGSRVPATNGSHVMALLDDDLDCSNLDI